MGFQRSCESDGIVLVPARPPRHGTFLLGITPSALPFISRTLGAYSRWLDFHPSNQEFLQNVAALVGTSMYRWYVKDLPPVFAQAVVNATIEPMLSKGGRFLQQDYRTGDRLFMKPVEREFMVQQALYIGVERALYSLRKALGFILGDARFGCSRETSMARISLSFLRDLEGQLFGRFADASKSAPDGSSKIVVTAIPERVALMETSAIRLRTRFQSQETGSPDGLQSRCTIWTLQ